MSLGGKPKERLTALGFADFVALLKGRFVGILFCYFFVWALLEGYVSMLVEVSQTNPNIATGYSLGCWRELVLKISTELQVLAPR